MKKIWPFGLVLLVVGWAICPSIGYFGQLWPHLEQVGNFLKNEKPTDQFLITPQNAADFKWVDAHEFWHDGQLFDVQKKEISGDTTRLFARADGFEKKLHQDFANFFTHKNSPESTQKVFWKIWQTHPFLVQNVCFESIFYDFLVKNGFSLKNERWDNRSILPIYLPPRG